MLKINLQRWKKQSYHSHFKLYRKAERIGLYCKTKTIVDLWSAHLAFHKFQYLKLHRIATENGYKNLISWTLRRWKQNILTAKNEKLMEDSILEKWKEVRSWLAEED